MLTKRIIPCLDVKDGRIVKGTNFVGLRDAGDPVEVAKQYDKQKADEIIFLDITASYEKRGIMMDIVRQTAEQVFMPLTVGGGIESIEDISKILNAGADKVSINTAAVKNPSLIREASEKFGSQCIVIAVDSKKTDTGFEVFTHGGRFPTGKNTIEWVKTVAALGAGEILLTSMDADGTKNGYDIEVTERVCSSINIPVIASGGAGKIEDFLEVFIKTSVDAALAASVFHYNEISIEEVKAYLSENNVNIRR